MRAGHQSEREARSRRETKRKYEGGAILAEQSARIEAEKRRRENIYILCEHKKIIEHQKNSARSTRLIILIAHGGRKRWCMLRRAGCNEQSTRARARILQGKNNCAHHQKNHRAQQKKDETHKIKRTEHAHTQAERGGVNPTSEMSDRV